MNRIDSVFRSNKQRGRKTLIGYVTAGFPDKDALRSLIPKLAEAGADIIEIGIPFSDPIADGPTIQQASQKALEGGVTLEWIFAEVAAIRRTSSTPLVFMSYSNPIYKLTPKIFFERAEMAGIDGVIIPDLIPEEGHYFEEEAERHGIHVIYLVAPTTPKTRIREVASRTRGFLYAVSLSGVTGARAELPKELPKFLDQARAVSPVPIAVGFGISTPEHARVAAAHADGIIVGSALIREIESSHKTDFEGAANFMRSLRQALDTPRKEAHDAAR